MNGRVLAIGDIHGCATALRTLLAGIELMSEDTVVVLGDLVDRGPDSKGVVERLIQLAREATLIAILGNHDEIMLESLERGSPGMMWMGAGGMATLDSYGGSIDGIPEAHIQFLKSMRDFWQTETHIFVHACVDPDVPLEGQVGVWLRWCKLTGNEERHRSGKTVVCGHTSLASGRPAFADGFVCIDTKAYAGQWLTCLEVNSETVWQANESGELRGPVPLREIGAAFSAVRF